MGHFAIGDAAPARPTSVNRPDTMFLHDTDKAQAVLFFGKEGISKELLYPELEALLDGFVPLEEWASTTQKAAYVEFNYQFVVTAAVFFTMAFDAKGGMTAKMKGGISATVEGGVQGEFKGGAMATLKGGIVMIN